MAAQLDPVRFRAHCPICDTVREFEGPSDYWGCRESLSSRGCPLGGCCTRERALAKVVFSLFPRKQLLNLRIHEAAPAARGLAAYLKQHAPGYVASGYFPGRPFGSTLNGIRNEDLERQTFEDACFDLVVHLDVLEHLFDPFAALREAYRTLKPGGYCCFAAPTYAERVTSTQVAFREGDGAPRVVGEPEYHGNPQDPAGGSLVTWRYGYDLPLLISRATPFDVEMRRWQSRSDAILGPMTEVYVLSKNTQ